MSRRWSRPARSPTATPSAGPSATSAYGPRSGCGAGTSRTVRSRRRHAEVLDRQRALIEKFPSGGRVEGWVTLVGHDLASDELLAGAADLARELGTGMTMHLSPTSSDPERYLERTGRRPVAHLDRLGVLGSHLLIGHGVWLDDEEVELILASDTAIAYCPWAYLRLGQGVFANGRHAEIVERGGRVALGCDAGNAGDAIDILRVAALAAGIARDARLDATRFGAHEVFELATIAGARAIGMGEPDRLDRGRQTGRPRRPPHRHPRLDTSGGCRSATRVGNRRSQRARRLRRRAPRRSRRSGDDDRRRRAASSGR